MRTSKGQVSDLPYFKGMLVIHLLRKLPDFDNAWSPTVQQKWMTVFNVILSVARDAAADVTLGAGSAASRAAGAE